MAGFSADTEVTAEYITKLKELKQWEPLKPPVSDLASGSSYEGLVAVYQELEKTREVFLNLVDKTIMFLEKAEDSFDTSDRMSAAAISKAGAPKAGN